MMAFRLGVPQLLLFILCATAFVAAQAPPMSDNDLRMVKLATEKYEQAHNLAGVYYRPGEINLNSFKDIYEFRNKIHRAGSQPARALLIGENKSLLHFLGIGKVTYYSTLIKPTDAEIGNILSLPRDLPNQHDLLAMAVWRHEGNKAKLLGIHKFPDMEVDFKLKNLNNIIPLNKIKELH